MRQKHRAYRLYTPPRHQHFLCAALSKEERTVCIVIFASDARNVVLRCFFQAGEGPKWLIQCLRTNPCCRILGFSNFLNFYAWNLCLGRRTPLHRGVEIIQAKYLWTASPWSARRQSFSFAETEKPGLRSGVLNPESVNVTWRVNKLCRHFDYCDDEWNLVSNIYCTVSS